MRAAIARAARKSRAVLRRRPRLRYNSPDKISGGVTYGGYSTSIVVNESFVLRVRDNVDLAATAPLFVRGITTYSPLRYHKIDKGMKVGVVGLGGLGHMESNSRTPSPRTVVLFTTSPNKAADAKRFGARQIVVSKNEEEMKAHTKSFDFILDTVFGEAQSRRLS